MSETTYSSSAAGLGEAGRTLALGVSQIFLQESWLAGVLMVAGLALYSVPLAAMAVLGALVATVAARLVALSVANGLQGYCGALVGAAAWTSFGSPWPAVLATVVGAAACPAVTQAFAGVFARFARAGGPLPVLTAPFCVVSGLIALLVRAVLPPVTPSVAVASGNPVVQLAEAVLTGVGQVVFAQSWLAGLVILVGLFVAGWRVGLAGLIGSLLGTLTGWAAGATPAELSVGLAGYSPCLTAIALAVVFLRPGRTAWLLACVGAVATVGVQHLLLLTPIPVYTWPFIVTTWLMLLIADGARG